MTAPHQCHNALCGRKHLLNPQHLIRFDKGLG